jgi:hypothetical protein
MLLLLLQGFIIHYASKVGMAMPSLNVTWMKGPGPKLSL